MDAIKDIIPQIIGTLSKGQTGPLDVGQLWARLYGADKCSSVAAFKDGCLTVHVDGSARLVKMNLNKAQYLEELNKKDPRITSIRFKVGKI